MWGRALEEINTKAWRKQELEKTDNEYVEMNDLRNRESDRWLEGRYIRVGMP